MILLKDGFKEVLHSLYFSERKCNTYCWDVFLKSYIYIEKNKSTILLHTETKLTCW